MLKFFAEHWYVIGGIISVIMGLISLIIDYPYEDKIQTAIFRSIWCFIFSWGGVLAWTFIFLAPIVAQETPDDYYEHEKYYEDRLK